jgi:hypothetical protein
MFTILIDLLPFSSLFGRVLHKLADGREEMKPHAAKGHEPGFLSLLFLRCNSTLTIIEIEKILLTFHRNTEWTAQLLGSGKDDKLQLPYFLVLGVNYDPCFILASVLCRKQGGGSDPRRCTNSSHRCHHAAHAYTGLSCRQLRQDH